MNKCDRDIKRQKILEFVYRFWDHKLEECSPNIVLNHECGIDGDDAVDLIYDCGELLNISDQKLDNFPFDTYFNSESVISSGGINWKNIFLFPFLIPIAFLV